MKYEAQIGDRRLSVELEQRDGQISAQIGERAYDAEVVFLEDGVYLIFLDNAVYEARVSGTQPDAMRVRLRARDFAVSIIDPKHRRQTTEHGTEGQQQLIAPMPGKIARVLLAAGDEVAAGQGVVVVEAMKMQNEVKSPRAGRVVEIRVRDGDTVNANQVLAVVE